MPKLSPEEVTKDFYQPIYLSIRNADYFEAVQQCVQYITETENFERINLDELNDVYKQLAVNSQEVYKRNVPRKPTPPRAPSPLAQALLTISTKLVSKPSLVKEAAIIHFNGLKQEEQLTILDTVAEQKKAIRKKALSAAKVKAGK